MVLVFFSLVSDVCIHYALLYKIYQRTTIKSMSCVCFQLDIYCYNNIYSSQIPRVYSRLEEKKNLKNSHFCSDQGKTHVTMCHMMRCDDVL